MNILLAAIKSLSDALLYPKKLFFFKWTITTKDGKILYPLYRIIQGSLDVIFSFIIWKYYGIIPLIGYWIMWFFTGQEFLFYIFLGKIRELDTFVNPYW